MNIKKEYIKAYIESEVINNSKEGALWADFFVLLLIGLPTAYLGAYAEITKPLIILIIIFNGCWTLFLSGNLEKRKISFTAYKGSISLFISLLCIVASLKLLYSINILTKTIVISIIFIYMINILASIVYVLRKIKNDFHNKNKRKANYSTIGYIGFPILGLILGKWLSRNSQEGTMIFIIAVLLIVVGLVFLYGTHYFVKALFMINNKSDELG